MLTREKGKKKNKTKKTNRDSLCLQFHLGMLGEYDLVMTPADGGLGSGPLCGIMMVIQSSISLPQ